MSLKTGMIKMMGTTRKIILIIVIVSGGSCFVISPSSLSRVVIDDKEVIDKEYTKNKERSIAILAVGAR